jgi:hypothetical protein
MTAIPLSLHSGAHAVPQPLTPSLFPQDAHAVIYRPARSARTSGTARARDWKLRLERRSPPFIEPLMGWTAGDDTLNQVELSFSSLEAAIAYARRQGLQYTVHGVRTQEPMLRLAPCNSYTRDQFAENERRRRLARAEGTLGPDAIRDGVGHGNDSFPTVRRPAARAARALPVTRGEMRRPPALGTGRVSVGACAFQRLAANQVVAPRGNHRRSDRSGGASVSPARTAGGGVSLRGGEHERHCKQSLGVSEPGAGVRPGG